METEYIPGISDSNTVASGIILESSSTTPMLDDVFSLFSSTSPEERSLRKVITKSNKLIFIEFFIS
jgi:hypothetical protein